jgi:hypothetical protein
MVCKLTGSKVLEKLYSEVVQPDTASPTAAQLQAGSDLKEVLLVRNPTLYPTTIRMPKKRLGLAFSSGRMARWSSLSASTATATISQVLKDSSIIAALLIVATSRATKKLQLQADNR